MKKRNGAARAIPSGVFDVQEFLTFAHISRATLYDLWKEGRGPQQIKIGRRTLISHEAAAAWVQRMQAETPEVTGMDKDEFESFLEGDRQQEQEFLTETISLGHFRAWMSQRLEDFMESAHPTKTCNTRKEWLRHFGRFARRYPPLKPLP